MEKITKKEQEVFKPRNPEEEADRENIQALLDFANKFYHADKEEKKKIWELLLQEGSKIKSMN